MEDKRTHLIERAAARLGQSIPSFSVEKTVELIAPFKTSSADKTNSADATGRAGLIDEASLLKGGLIDWRRADNRIAEEFRVVLNELLQQKFVGDGKNIVMITSALQGEGKSFTALNLSAGIARHGHRRVLLIDADYKAGGLGNLLAPREARGLLDLATRSATDVRMLTFRTAIENLDFLPVGNSSGRDLELLSSQHMGDLIRDIGRNQSESIVILDVPPCLMSSAPNTLAASVGRIVLVVEANSTQEGDMTAAIELLHGCEDLSLILNKIPPWSGHSFGSYYV